MKIEKIRWETYEYLCMFLEHQGRAVSNWLAIVSRSVFWLSLPKVPSSWLTEINWTNPKFLNLLNNRKFIMFTAPADSATHSVKHFNSFSFSGNSPRCIPSMSSMRSKYLFNHFQSKLTNNVWTLTISNSNFFNAIFAKHCHWLFDLFHRHLEMNEKENIGRLSMNRHL